jgi:hypothetical protein
MRQIIPGVTPLGGGKGIFFYNDTGKLECSTPEFTYGHASCDCVDKANEQEQAKRRSAMLGTILIIVIVLMLLGALPTWPHSRQWGYFPSGGMGLVLLILVILLVLGRI